MVTLNEEMTIASSPDAIWPMLRDPAVVAGCIPGAELNDDSDDDVWRGSIRVKFGPTVALFRGEATLAFDDDSKRVTIDGRGIDGRGASRALANLVTELHVDDADENSTRMKVEGGFTVTGPLETFVNAGGVHVARALLSEFCTNIAAAVEQAEGMQKNAQSTSAVSDTQTTSAVEHAAEQRTEPGGTTQSPPTPSQTSEPPRQQTTELSASGLLWRALLGWFRNLFAKGN